MRKERELLKEAKEWMQELKYVWEGARDSGDSGDRVLLELIADINKVEELLAQSEQEPVAYAYDYLDSLYYSDDKDVADYPRISRDGRALYTSPPTREPLSDAQILDLFIGIGVGASTEIKLSVARAIEKALAPMVMVAGGEGEH